MRVTALELFPDPFRIEDHFQVLWRGGFYRGGPGAVQRAVGDRAGPVGHQGPGARRHDVAVDFHGRVHRAVAKRLVRALEPHGPLFFEGPVLPEQGEALREVARHGVRHRARFCGRAPGPGLGVEIDEERLREAARDARMWHNPVWRNDDRTVAEW